MVSNGTVYHIHISFMLTGHTKFAPDRLFATIGNAYKSADVFTINELQALCAQSAETIIETGEKVLVWRDILGGKYSDLPGVRKLHNCESTWWPGGNEGEREVFYWQLESITLASCESLRSRHTYCHLQGCTHTTSKRTKWRTCWLCTTGSFHHVDALTICHLSNSLQSFLRTLSLQSTSSASISVSLPESRKSKWSNCTVEGCDGTGHRNKDRWSEGHTTKAGCPRIHPS